MFLSRPHLVGACLLAVSLPTVAGDPPVEADPAPGKAKAAGLDRHGDPLPPRAIARLGTVRLRQGSAVESVAFSPNGQLMASAGALSLYIWDVATGRKQRQWQDPGGGGLSKAIVFSPDGFTLMAARENGVVQHWDVASGNLLGETLDMGYKPSKGKARFRAKMIIFSADRKFLALAGSKPPFWQSGAFPRREPEHLNALLLEVASGKRVLEIPDKYPVEAIAISHDSKILATGCRDRVIRLWDITTSKEIRQWKVAQATNSWITFSPDDTVLASKVGTGVQFWEVKTGKLIREFAAEGDQLAFSPDGKTLAVGSREFVDLWDVTTGRKSHRLKRELPENLTPGLVFSRDGKLISSAGAGPNAIGVWEVATGKPPHDFRGHSGMVSMLAFSPDGRAVTSLGAPDHRYGPLLTWHPTTQALEPIPLGKDLDCECFAYSPDGKIMALGVEKKDEMAHIQLWDIREKRVLRQFSIGTVEISRLVFSPDGKILASAGHGPRFSKDKALEPAPVWIRLWDVATGKKKREIRFTQDNRVLAFSRDGKLLLVGGKDLSSRKSGNELGLWEIATGKKRFDLFPDAAKGSSVFAGFFLPDDKTVATVTQTNLEQPLHLDVRFWNSETGHEQRPSQQIPVFFSLRFSLAPDGKTLALNQPPDGATLALNRFAKDGLSILLWDLERGKPLTTLQGHDGALLALAFSPDSRILASGATDTTILLWDVASVRAGSTR